MAVRSGAAPDRPHQYHADLLAHRAHLSHPRAFGGRRKVRALHNREMARVLLDGSAATAIKFRKYMLVRTQMSAVTGLLVGAFAWITGLQFAVEMGRDRFPTQLHSLHRPLRRTSLSSS